MKHAREMYGGRGDVSFKMEIVKTFAKYNLKRKIDECVRINRNSGSRMNSKSEFCQPELPRVEVHRGNRA